MLRLFLCLLIFVFVAIRGHADMNHEAYIWQRSWSPRLETSVLAESSNLRGLTVLFAEVMRGTDGPAWVNVRPNLEVLEASNLPVTIAIRANVYSGLFDAGQPFTQCLLSEVEKALTFVKSAGLTPAAVEIDFDCATSKLEGYAQWLGLIRERLDGVPLSITTLPTWMSRPKAFRELVQATDRFVLQVHSIKRPKSAEESVLLCDPKDALRWVKQAATFGRPFHVALPTYSYRLGYDEDGALAEVAGENASLVQRSDWMYRFVRADANMMAGLVRQLESRRPGNCTGVIWYRLPIGGERNNWDSQTWRAVMAGRGSASEWEVKVIPAGDGVVELEIYQASEVATAVPFKVIVECDPSQMLAWDGQRQYQVKADLERGLIWQWSERFEPPLLPQGTRWTIGWLRAEDFPKLKISVVNNAD